MWQPADLNALPTLQDIIHAKKEIDETEKELKAIQAAVRRIPELKKKLSKCRAFIAPVRKLSFDVLSLIFEFCGEDEWKTAMKIATVSRKWRETILLTPRAWAFIDLKKCEDDYLIDLYFQRSGQLPLHLYLPDTRLLEEIFNIAHRLRCLALTSFRPQDDELIFPNVESFSIVDHGLSVKLYDINAARFPALRRFQCKPVLEYDETATSQGDRLTFAPLRTLSLDVYASRAWIKLAQSCQNSLVSLELYVGDEYSRDSHKRCTFPVLKYLHINLEFSPPAIWATDFVTPILTSYDETSSFTRKALSHRDLDTVEYLRSDLIPSLDQIPKVRIIQFSSSGSVRKAITRLIPKNGVIPCPCLEVLEVSPLDDRLESIARSMMPHVNEGRSIPVRLFCDKNWKTGLPGAIPAPMVCSVTHC